MNIQVHNMINVLLGGVHVLNREGEGGRRKGAELVSHH